MNYGLKSLWILGPLAFQMVGCKTTSGKDKHNDAAETNKQANCLSELIDGACPDGINQDSSSFIAGDQPLEADIPTVTFDIARDVALYAADPAQNNPGNLQTSKSSALRLAEPETQQITSSFGGLITVKFEELLAGQLKGVMEPSAFLGRQGFPAFESGSIVFDLKSSDTDIDGTIQLMHAKFSDTPEFNLDAIYKLQKEDGIWRGKMIGKTQQGGSVKPFEYDYDTPILAKLLAIPLDAEGKESRGPLTNGGKVRLKLAVNSNAPVNWVNYIWESPTAILLGGGNGVTSNNRDLCKAKNFGQSERVFCEHTRGFWTYWNDYTVSKYQPSGTYTFKVSVRNAAMLTSRELKAGFEVQNPLNSTDKPVIEQVTLNAPSSLENGEGGTVKLEMLVASSVPLNWLNLSLQGPTSNIFGGGGGKSFQECSSFSENKPALCGSRGSGYWYKSYTYEVSPFAENGAYKFDHISVRTEGDIKSESYTAVPSFTVAGNVVATTPVIDSGNLYVVPNYGDDPSTRGKLLTGGCLVASAVPDPLVVALVLNVSASNVPVNWLNRSFEGPVQNLEGGGSQARAINLGSGAYQIIHYNSVASPLSAPKGLYYFHRLSVRNEGNRTSAAFGGMALGFTLKTSCP